MFTRCCADDCKRKLNPAQQIIGKCYCSLSFCPVHRLNHDCKHDYSADFDKEAFIAANKCVADKLEKVV